MPVRATGRRERRAGIDLLVLERTLPLPPAGLWAAVTEPARLARWIATWGGDPRSGRVQVRMLAEGDDVAAVEYEVRACDPPRRLALRYAGDVGVWEIELTVAAADGGAADGSATLTFTQVVHDPAALDSIGPGWDYYLDRLVAAETGGDPGAVAWEDYHPALAAHYRELPTPPAG